ncbi:MAG TPA: HAD family hydrolase [Prolixibacteraceae bacterium]|jgi:putative hydrolase of the HAD superfamily|nr:HAD family hydrolase [Prolixibacteraceae bacterium]
MSLKHIKVIGFDADDTLWVNEPYFQDAGKQFCRLLNPYIQDTEITAKELFKTEINNLDLYGYGVKAFILSMIETAIRITGGKIKGEEISTILEMGNTILTMPIKLLDDVEAILKKLNSNYLFILVTKGDLLDQERKLQKSGLIDYFHHVEIMSDKHEDNYRKLLMHLNIKPEEFLMVGNSVKSDILPVINIGATAIHVPFEVTWQHEVIHDLPETNDFITVSKLSEILNLL